MKPNEPHPVEFYGKDKAMYDNSEAITKDTFYKIGFDCLEQVAHIYPGAVKKEMLNQDLDPYSYDLATWRAVFKEVERLGEEYEKGVVALAVSAVLNRKDKAMKHNTETGHLIGHVKLDLEKYGAVVTMPSGDNSHSIMIARFPDGQTWHVQQVIGPNKYRCNFTECDHGMGLAGRESCPGDPKDKDCDQFTTEFGEASDPIAGDGTLPKDNDMCKLLYCNDCVNWDRAGCLYVVKTEPHHPVAPQKVFGNHEVLNKDNDCPHHKRKDEGLGIVGDGGLLKDDERCGPKAGG